MVNFLLYVSLQRIKFCVQFSLIIALAESDNHNLQNRPDINIYTQSSDKPFQSEQDMQNYLNGVGNDPISSHNPMISFQNGFGYDGGMTFSNGIPSADVMGFIPGCGPFVPSNYGASAPPHRLQTVDDLVLSASIKNHARLADETIDQKKLLYKR